jgi:uncharacterized protein (DUF779 family)
MDITTETTGMKTQPPARVPRVVATPAALDLIDLLREAHGPLMFHQSGGCCDGSQPMCFASGEFRIGYSDVCLGLVDGIEFWMGKDQFAYWRHTQLLLDVTDGRGSSFSLEIPLGKRFIVRSRVFTDEESLRLEEVRFLLE